MTWFDLERSRSRVFKFLADRGVQTGEVTIYLRGVTFGDDFLRYLSRLGKIEH